MMYLQVSVNVIEVPIGLATIEVEISAIPGPSSMDPPVSPFSLAPVTGTFGTCVHFFLLHPLLL